MNWEECIQYFDLSEYECHVYTTGPAENIGHVFYEFYDNGEKIAASQIRFNFESKRYGIDTIWVHPKYQNQNIGRRMAAAYYDVAVHMNMVTSDITTSTTINPDGPGSEPWLTCIGPEVNLLDPNDPYVIWQKEFRAAQG